MMGNALLFFGSLAAILWTGLSYFRTAAGIGGKEADASCETAAGPARSLMSLRFVILALFFLSVVNADVFRGGGVQYAVFSHAYCSDSVTSYQ